MNGHHDRLPERLDPVDERMGRAARRLGIGGRCEGDELIDIGAGDEVVALPRPEDHRSDRGIGAQRLEAAPELGAVGVTEGVDRLAGHVQRNHGDAGPGDRPGENRHR